MRLALGRRTAVLGIGVTAGLVLVASAVTAQGTDLRAGSRTDLPSLIRDAERRGDATQLQIDRRQAEVAALTPESARGEQAALGREAAQLGATVGLVELRGPGIRVTLDDAPREGALRPGLGPDDVLVHQQDVQGVVNALWMGGADGVQVMDQRILSTSAVRCVGNTLILAGRVYSPPYVVTAVGDPDRLAAALADEPSVALFKDYVAIAGLRYAEQRLDDVTLVAAPGPPMLKHVVLP